MKKISIIWRVLVVLLTDWRLAQSLVKNQRHLRKLVNQTSSNNRPCVFIALTGHLGDLVATEPVANWVRKEYPSAITGWIVNKQFAAVVNTHPALDEIIEVTSLTEWILLKRLVKGITTYDMHIDETVCERHGFLLKNPNAAGITMSNYLDKGNLLFAFSRTAGIEIDHTTAPTLHLKAANASLPFTNYIVMHTSARHPAKKWQKACWDDLAAWILDQSPGCHVIEIGAEQQITITNSRFHNYTGEKDLREIADMIKQCELFIGIDSSFAHFANALEKDAIILIGHLGNFRSYMPYSGKFQRGKKDAVLYFPGPLSSMPIFQVFPMLTTKLDVLSCP